MKKLVRKMLAVLTASAAVMTFSVTAFAHHGGGRHRAVSYPICAVAGCLESSTHIHDGQTYCGHAVGDGCTHGACAVSGCTLSGPHTHQGQGHHGGCR